MVTYLTVKEALNAAYVLNEEYFPSEEYFIAVCSLCDNHQALYIGFLHFAACKT